MMRRTLATLVSAIALVALACPASAQGNLASPAALNEKAPATYKAKFDTTKATASATTDASAVAMTSRRVAGDASLHPVAPSAVMRGTLLPRRQHTDGYRAS